MISILHEATRDAINAAASGTLGTRCAGVVNALADAFGGLACSAEVYDSSDNLLCTVSLAAWVVDDVSATKSITAGATTGSVFSNAGTPALVIFRDNGGAAIFEADAGVGAGTCRFQQAIAATVPVEMRLSFTADPALDESEIEPPAITIGGTATLPTTIVLSMDDTVVPTSSELVTFGVPLSKGVVTNLSQVKVTVGGVERPISVKGGLRWHWLDNSFRSVTVQMVVDMTGGDVEVVVSNTGRNTANDIAGWPVMDGWTDSGFRDILETVLLKPRVIPLHDRTYLAASGLVPPFVPLDKGTADGALQDERFWKQTFGVLDSYFPWKTMNGTSTYSQIDYDCWLFDRPSSLFRLSMQVETPLRRRAYLRNAALSKRHYMHWVNGVGDIDGGYVAPYWWNLKMAAENGPSYVGKWSYSTTMYQSCQHLKLALALLGDDTQWTTAMLLKWAEDIRVKANTTAGRDYTHRYATYTYPSEEPYLNAGVTERLLGLPSIFHLAVWEITGDATVRASIDKRLAYLKDMQQTHRAYEIANGWPVSSGAWRHSASKHGSDAPPEYVGTTLTSLPAGAKSVRIKTYLSDEDMIRWPQGNGKSFAFIGKGGRRVASTTKVSDGIWDIELASGFSTDMNAGTDFNLDQGMFEAPYVQADAGMFSPWMTVTIVDFLWQTYCLLGVADAAEMIRRAGHSINEWGFHSSIDADNVTMRLDPPDYYTGNLGNTVNTGSEFAVSVYAANEFKRGVWVSGGAMWTHREILLPLALAYLIETNAVKRQRLKTRIDTLIQYNWRGAYDYAPTTIPNPRRMVNWVNVYSPYTTWLWVEQETQ